MITARFKNENRIYCNDWRVVVNTNERGKLIVGFYDMTQDKEKFPEGQFVAQYYVDSLINHPGFELRLYTEVPFWTIKYTALQIIKDWLSHIEQV